ncbi:hypothetical protein Droror1_Dr00009293 [Drosera rotundifolia]
MNASCLSPSVGFPSTPKQASPYIPLCTHFSSSQRKFLEGHHCSWSCSPPLRFHSSLLHAHHLLPIRATLTPDEEAVVVVDFEDLAEKDWSFLDIDETNSKEDRDRKTSRVIAAGNVGPASKVMVSMGSDDFVDMLMATSTFESLLLVHDSLFVLAGIRERYDDDHIRCWQGPLPDVPGSWAPFDAIFLYFLPAMPFELDEVLAVLSARCSPGARVVVSHLQGKQLLEHQRQQHPDVVVSELPDMETLEKIGANHSFVLKEFEDELGFYLAVLELAV